MRACQSNFEAKHTKSSIWGFYIFIYWAHLFSALEAELNSESLALKPVDSASLLAQCMEVCCVCFLFNNYFWICETLPSFSSLLSFLLFLFLTQKENCCPSESILGSWGKVARKISLAFLNLEILSCLETK